MRERKKKENARTKIFKLRVSEGELGELKEMAALRGLTMSDTVREALSGYYFKLSVRGLMGK